MTTAELQANPTAEMQEFLDTAVEASATSESTVRKDFRCDDGILAVSSHGGEPIEYTVCPLLED